MRMPKVEDHVRVVFDDHNQSDAEEGKSLSVTVHGKVVGVTKDRLTLDSLYPSVPTERKPFQNEYDTFEIVRRAITAIYRYEKDVML